MAALFCLFLFAAKPAQASLPDTYYFWIGPNEGNPRTDSFVIAVPQRQGSEILALLAKGKMVGVSTEIAAGRVSYNKDYFSPERQVWNWHVVSVTKFFDFAETVFIAALDPRLDSSPSDIEADPRAWIARYGTSYTPRYYHIISPIDPVLLGLVVNVSNRAQTGTGENTSITGFMVQGGEPRNVAIRALGPSLRASGIVNVAANPSIEVFREPSQISPYLPSFDVSRGSRKIASNADWREGVRANLLTRLGLAPSDEKEAALYLTLLPGSYTIHTANDGGRQGVAVTEVYDVDGGAPVYRIQ
jgi:hypothetical protein